MNDTWNSYLHSGRGGDVIKQIAGSELPVYSPSGRIMDFAVCAGAFTFLLIDFVNPMSVMADTRWRSKAEVARRRSWKADLKMIPGTRLWLLVELSQ